MIEIKIKVLKDTPFDKAGDELTISDFRLKYDYVCSKSVTNDELIKYLNTSPYPPRISEFFVVIEYPLDFIYEGFVYRKELDGFYHKFPASVPFIPENSLDILTCTEAHQIIKNAKFRKKCLYLSNNANKKL